MGRKKILPAAYIPIKRTRAVEQDPKGRILDIAVWYFPYQTEYSILNLSQLNEQTNGLQ